MPHILKRLRDPFIFTALCTGAIFGITLTVNQGASDTQAKNFQQDIIAAKIDESTVNPIDHLVKTHIVTDEILTGPTTVAYEGNLAHAPLSVVSQELPVSGLVQVWPGLDTAQRQLIDLVAQDLFMKNLSEMQRIRMMLAITPHGEPIPLPNFENLTEAQKAPFRRQAMEDLHQDALTASGPSKRSSVI